MTASANRPGDGNKHRLIALHNPAEEDIPPFFQVPFLFLQPRHLLAQPHRDLFYFALFQQETGVARAHCAFYRQNEWAVSPSAASFGSVEFDGSLTDDELFVFLNAVVDRLREERVRGVQLVNYPDCYAPGQALRLRSLFAEAGFQTVREMVNHHLPVSARPFAPLHTSERRRLKKCHAAGFRSGVWTQPRPDEVYDRLRTFRQHYNYPVALPEDRFQELLERFPDEFIVFGVWDGDTVACLTVGVRVSPTILYNFFPAGNPEYRNFSPSVMLTEAMYEYCQQEGLTMLDLGVSTDHLYQPKPGLIQFKARLGGLESLKTVYELIF